jgi:hypothetical protein
MTSAFRSRRSRVHLALLGVVGLVLLIVAFDMLAGYWFSSEAAVDTAGALTNRGQAQRRLDLVWGTVFIIAGLGFFAMSLWGLAERRSLAEIGSDGLRLRVLGPGRFMLIPWRDIFDIRSRREPGNGGHPRPTLVVGVEHPELYPPDLWEAAWSGRWLRMDADQWVDPVEEFVVRANLELDRSRREGDPATEPQR